MNTFKTTLFFISLVFTSQSWSQETSVSAESKQEKRSYYEDRAIEDAQYEQKLSASSDKDDQAFWAEQKEYEQDLKKNNKRAYRVYMQRKKRAYAEHHNHCDSHCHHSDYYYQQASFYYYDYNNNYNNRPYYRSSPSRNTINTGVRVNTPSVRLGIF